METLRTGGMKGRRLGKHRVPEGDIDVQLGEDLSESLRALKVCCRYLFFLFFFFAFDNENYMLISGVFSL